MPAEFEWTSEAIQAARVAYYAASPVPQGMLNAAVKAQPVVNAPPCPTCQGSGTTAHRADGGGATDGEFIYDLPCPACGGSGRDRLIPKSEIRAWIESRRNELPRLVRNEYEHAKEILLDDLERWLDERRAER